MFTGMSRPFFPSCENHEWNAKDIASIKKRREEKVPVIVHEGHLCLVFARVLVVFAAAHSNPTHELAGRSEKKKNSRAHNHDIATHIFESN